MLCDRVQEGFLEVKFFIEGQQRVVDESGDDPMAFILADKGLALGHRLIAEKLVLKLKN